MAGFVLFLAVINAYTPENNKFNTNLKLYIDTFIRGWLRVFALYSFIFIVFYTLSQKKLTLKKL